MLSGFTGITLLSGGFHAEGYPCLSVVVGDIPEVIITYFKLWRYTVFSVLTGRTCFSLVTLVTFVAFIALFALLSGFTGITLFSGGFHTEGYPCLSVVVGDIPEVIITYFKLWRYTVFSVLTGRTCFSLVTLVTFVAFIALFALLSGFTGITLFSGGFHTEGYPCLSVVVGDIPEVIITYFKLWRYTVFSVLTGRTCFSLVTLVAFVTFIARQLRQSNQIIPDRIITVLPLYKSIIYIQFNLLSICAVISL